MQANLTLEETTDIICALRFATESALKNYSAYADKYWLNRAETYFAIYHKLGGAFTWGDLTHIFAKEAA